MTIWDKISVLLPLTATPHVIPVHYRTPGDERVHTVDEHGRQREVGYVSKDYCSVALDFTLEHAPTKK